MKNNKSFSTFKHQILVENSMYATPQEKEELLKDEGRLIDLLVVNFFGMLGVLNATPDSKKISIQQHFRRDGQVRLKAISDKNLDISLIIKLAAEARLFRSPALVNEITKFLFLLKSGKIRDVDSRIVAGWAEQIKPSAINKISNPIVKKAFKEFVADQGMTVDISEFAMTIRRRVKGMEGTGEFAEFSLRGGLKAKTAAMQTKDDDSDDGKPQGQAQPAPQATVDASTGNNIPKKQSTQDKVAISDTVSPETPEAKKEEPLKRQEPFVVDEEVYGRLYIGLMSYPSMASSAIDDLVNAIMNDGLTETKSLEIIGKMEKAIRNISRFEWDKAVEEHPRYVIPFDMVALLAARNLGNSSPLKEFVFFGERLSEMRVSPDTLQYYLLRLIEKIGKNPDWWEVRFEVLPVLKFLPPDELTRIIKNQIYALDNSAKARSLPGRAQIDVYNFLNELEKSKPDYEYPIQFHFTKLSGTTDVFRHSNTVFSYSGISRFFNIMKESNISPSSYIYKAVREYCRAEINNKGPIEIVNDITMSSPTYQSRFEFSDTILDEIINKKLRTYFDMIIDQMERGEDIEYGDKKNLEIFSTRVNHHYFFISKLGYTSDQVKNLLETTYTNEGTKARMFVMMDLENALDPKRKLSRDEVKKELNALFKDPKSTSDLSFYLNTLGIKDRIQDTRPELLGDILIAVAKSFNDNPDDFFVKNQSAKAVGSDWYSSSTDVISRLIIDLGLADQMSAEQATEFLRYVSSGTVLSLSPEAIKSIRKRDQKRAMKNTVASLIFSAIQTDEGSLAAANYLDTLDTYMQNNIRSALIGSSTVAIELLEGEVGTGRKMDSSRLRGALLINGINLESMEGATFPRKKKNENLVDYIKRATENLPKIMPDPPVVVNPEENTKEFKDRKTFELNNKNYAGVHGTNRIKVLKVYTGSDAMTQEFIEFRKNFENDTSLPTQTVIPAFHGTAQDVGAFIARFGFKVIKTKSDAVQVTGRMLGDGIYFTNKIDKACQYLKNDARGGYSREAGNKGYVFELDNTLGMRGTDCDYAGVWDRKGGIRSPEWVVRDPKKQLHILKIYEVVTITEKEYYRDIKSQRLSESKNLVSFSTYLQESKMQQENYNRITFSFVDKVVPVVTKSGSIELIPVHDEDGRKKAEGALPKYAELDVQDNAVHVKFPYHESGGYMTMFARSMPSEMKKHYIKKWKEG